jgi:hypothetical protein
MRRFLITLCFFVVVATALAHPMPSSVVELSVNENAIRGTSKIPLIELANAVGDQRVTRLSDPFFINYFIAHIQAYSPSGKWKTIIQRVTMTTDQDPMIGTYQEVLVKFIIIPPVSAELRKFTFKYDAVIHQVVTHSALISVTEDWNNGLHAESDAQEIGVIRLDVPSGKIFPLQVDLAEGSSWTGFKSMVTLGMQHIQAGTDHLLFILALLLPAMLIVKAGKWGQYGGIRYSALRLFRIVTAFTVGHSITLLAGAMGWLRLPSQPVEIMIAISILVSSVHAIRPIFPGRESFVAAGFGLIHGLAFATVLANLHLNTTRLVLSILGFNLGIEIMQLFVIAIIVPWFIILSVHPIYKWVRVGGALLASVAAVGWIIQRSAGHDNVITNFIETIAANALWLIIALVLFAVITFIFSRVKLQRSLQRPDF